MTRAERDERDAARRSRIYQRYVELHRSPTETAKEFGVTPGAVEAMARQEEMKMRRDTEASIVASQSERMRLASGQVSDRRKLVAFLYMLLRDHLTVDKVESMMMQLATLEEGHESHYTNGWMASHAKDIALRLTGLTDVFEHVLPEGLEDEVAEAVKRMVGESMDNGASESPTGEGEE